MAAPFTLSGSRGFFSRRRCASTSQHLHLCGHLRQLLVEPPRHVVELVLLPCEARGVHLRGGKLATQKQHLRFERAHAAVPAQRRAVIRRDSLHMIFNVDQLLLVGLFPLIGLLERLRALESLARALDDLRAQPKLQRRDA